MKNVTTDIYCNIKPYKIKRLRFSKYFRALYNGTFEPKLNLTQYEYKICTHCWLQRLNEDDILKVMGAWYKKHNTIPNFGFLRNVVIPETKLWTADSRKAQKKAEYERAKAKRTKGGS